MTLLEYPPVSPILPPWRFPEERLPFQVFQVKLTRCNMAARIRWMDSTSSGLKPMILIASITAWWFFSSLSKA